MVTAWKLDLEMTCWMVIVLLAEVCVWISGKQLDLRDIFVHGQHSNDLGKPEAMSSFEQ